jgi:hypothetical protein
MDIKFPTHQQRMNEAYQAGYDFGRGSGDDSCHDSKHFEHTDLSDRWEAGCNDGLEVRESMQDDNGGVLVDG